MIDSAMPPSDEIPTQIAAQVPQDALVIYASYGEPSLIFYANRPLGKGLVRLKPDALGALRRCNFQAA